jgi:S-adenosyl-L-methionine hydrolase (adenosine-forming)
VAARAGGSIFFLTDYGLADEFAGVVRAAVLRRAPAAPIVDLTHGVPPFDVRAGALTLVRAVPHLGPGVVVAVVDPGVGTARRAIAISVRPSATTDGPHHFVGPDNGLLPWAVDAVGGIDRVVALARRLPEEAGATFDGRDVFAPAAARLWQGTALSELGEDIDPGDLGRLDPARSSTSPGALEAEVDWVDRFGNVQLAAGPEDASRAGLGDELEVVAGTAHQARRVSAFTALGPHTLGLLVDANGRLALVCDRESAATVLRVQAGDVVTVRRTAPGRGAP